MNLLGHCSRCDLCCCVQYPAVAPSSNPLHNGSKPRQSARLHSLADPSLCNPANQTQSRLPQTFDKHKSIYIPHSSSLNQ